MENPCKGFDNSLLETGVSKDSTCHFWFLNYFTMESRSHMPLRGVEDRDNGLVKISFGILLEPALREIRTPSIVRLVSFLDTPEHLKGQSCRD